VEEQIAHLDARAPSAGTPAAATVPPPGQPQTGALPRGQLVSNERETAQIAAALARKRRRDRVQSSSCRAFRGRGSPMALAPSGSYAIVGDAGSARLAVAQTT